MNDFVTPSGQLPPQLAQADLLNLSPQDITLADTLGQLEVLKSGRQPLPFEKAGERRATADEDALARIEQAEAQRVADSQARAEITRSLNTEGI